MCYLQRMNHPAALKLTSLEADKLADSRAWLTPGLAHTRLHPDTCYTMAGSMVMRYNFCPASLSSICDYIRSCTYAACACSWQDEWLDAGCRTS